MASKRNKIILALVFLLITPPSLGQMDSYRTCFLMCIDLKCPGEYVNLHCLQGCNSFFGKKGEKGASQTIIGGRPMLTSPTGGSSESNGQSQQMNSTDQILNESNVQPNLGSNESSVQPNLGSDESSVQPNQGSNKSNVRSSPMMTNSLERLKNSSVKVNSTQGLTKELNGRPMGDGAIGEDTTMMNPMEELRKSNGWPMMGDSTQGTKGPSMEQPTSHTMEEEEESKLTNSMEGLKEYGALPMLLGSWGGGHN